MDILFVAESHIPSETAMSVHVMSMCEALAKAGHRVKLVARGSSRREDPFSFYGVERLFELHRYRKEKGSSLPYYLRFLPRHLKPPPDLVYCMHAKSRALARRTIPFVYESHDYPVKTGDRLVEKQLFRRTGFRKLVVVNDRLKRDYIEGFAELDESSVQVVPPAHRVAEPGGAARQPAGGLPKDKDSFKVGYTGTLQPHKGIGTLLEVARRAGWADFHIIGGTGEELRYWRRKAEDLPNVRFHGFVPPGQVERYQRSCDALVAPYCLRRWSGGGAERAEADAPEREVAYRAPQKLFEYMAAGKPIVCSDFASMRAILREDETAVFCGPEDPAEWVSALKKLRDNPSRCRALGNAARRELEEKYSYRARVRRILEPLKRTG